MSIFYFPKNVLKSRSDKKDKFPIAAKLKAVNEIYKNTARVCGFLTESNVFKTSDISLAQGPLLSDCGLNFKGMGA